MPRFNQKGPMGLGPMTGRRMGRCTNFGGNQIKDVPGSATDNMNQNTPENLIDSENEYGRGRGFGSGGRMRDMGRQNRFRGGF